MYSILIVIVVLDMVKSEVSIFCDGLVWYGMEDVVLAEKVRHVRSGKHDL